MSENAVRPKLVLADASAALGWYAEQLGAREVSRYVIAGSLVFAEMEVLDTRVTLKDADDADPVPVPGVLLDVVLDDPDTVAERMVAAGAVVVFPVADQPYGARGGRLRDPFGVQWLLQTPVTMSPDEVRAAFGEV
jgi:PhnB protein